MSATTFGWLTLLFPLVGTLCITFGWKLLPGRSAGWVGFLAIAISFAMSIGMLATLLGQPDHARQMTSSLWDYAVTTGIDARMQILVDPLSVWMALIVSGISALIHLYSIGYMTSDRGFRRFFAYLNYFVLSMLLLVLAGNFLLLIVGWAFVGAASYLLISFWYRRTTATSAGIKAFVINVVGDVGLVLGTYFIFRHTGTLTLLGSFHKIDGGAFTGHHGDLIAGSILFLVGAFAKSAQVPLHTWLPDAMEGPTPVSALIHAATMVTAGVYLIARLHPLYEHAPAAAYVGQAVGGLTLFMAASIALVVVDIKRVIAYSTMSQIGYMIMGVSSGAYAGGMFHLMTHAFFKALLFMAAGSVIGAMANVQSMDRMSGFRRAMPFTFVTFLAGGLALAAVPGFSGYFSKDDILAYMGHLGGAHWVLYAVGYIAAFMTAIYTFRMVFRVFGGNEVPEASELAHGHLHHADPPRNPANNEAEDTDVGFPGPEHNIAERSWPMRIAMTLLAIGAFGAGFIGIPRVTSVVPNFLAPTFADSTKFDPSLPTWLVGLGLGLSALASVGGIGVAYLVWVRKVGVADLLRRRLSALHGFLVHLWYWDELIGVVAIRPAAWFGRFSQSTFERLFVNGLLVGGSTGVVRVGSATVRAAQSGFLRYYAGLLIMGLLGTGLYFLISAS
jgi:NADH-quinone oxidoreductase subunit L